MKALRSQKKVSQPTKPWIFTKPRITSLNQVKHCGKTVKPPGVGVGSCLWNDSIQQLESRPRVIGNERAVLC
jgi:hypothetical protein